MMIKCALCEHQIKISRPHFVDVFYACEQNLNPLEEDIDDATVNSSIKVRQVIEIDTCSDFRKKDKVKINSMEARLVDELTDDDL